MKDKRADILLPHKTAQEAVRRKKLLRLLESGIPTWKDADHPELRSSAAEFVRELRQEGETKRTSKRHAKK